MSSTDEFSTASGRPIILESTPPGFWAVVLGAGVALLAPLFGFLLGSILANNVLRGGFPGIFVGLFSGVLVGGVGAVIAIYGGWKLFHSRGSEDHSESI